MRTSKSLRAVACVWLLAALPACGFKADDPEFEEAARWHSELRRADRDLAARLAAECRDEINPGWNRDDTVKMIDCMRSKAEASA